MPKISIITPSYNGVPYISRMLDSVLAQTYDDFEHIIVDDGSTDETCEVLKTYAKTDSRIKTFFRNHHGNPAIHRKYGVEKSIGEYICFLDQDDLWMPEKLQKQLEFYTEHSDFGALFTGALEINKEDRVTRQIVPSKNGHPIWNWIFKQEKQDRDSKYFTIDPKLLIFGTPLSCNSSMFPRAIYDELGGLDESSYLLGVEDYEFWVRLGEKYKIGIINEPLLHSRWTGSNLSKYTSANYAHIFSHLEKKQPGLIAKILKPWDAFGKRRWAYLLSSRSKLPDENNFKYLLSKKTNLIKFYFYALISRTDGSYKKFRQ